MVVLCLSVSSLNIVFIATPGATGPALPFTGSPRVSEDSMERAAEEWDRQQREKEEDALNCKFRLLFVGFAYPEL